MSISSTRKVSQSTQANKKPAFQSGQSQEGSVEKIDTSNAVFIKDEERNSQNKNQQNNQQQPEEDNTFSTNAPYITNAIELQEENQDIKQYQRQNNLNAYQAQNKTTIENDEEEIDEFV